MAECGPSRLKTPVNRMESQSDDDFEYDDDDDVDDYYAEGQDEIEPEDEREPDPEYYEYTCLNVDTTKTFLIKEVQKACEVLKVPSFAAKALLMTHRWNLDDIRSRTKQDIANLLVECGILPSADSSLTKETLPPRNYCCPVCIEDQSSDQIRALLCGHFFCKTCWSQHLNALINEGIATGIQCMAEKCLMRAPEEFVVPLLTSDRSRSRYDDFIFKDCVKNHLQLKFCPGADCSIVFYAETIRSKRVECIQCKSNWCCACCDNYHAPADCEIIKRWLNKCADDSETVNYISAHTKDCPVCSICIEKNGGCNHMQCSKCLHNFCWMCLGDWKTHGSEYYECSRYKENPNIANESANVKAREALKKYLFYYERWDNHAKSLRLEQETLRKSQERIQEKVENKMGTWIDWQFLLAAASLLAKCRYTLQYTYPFAYYLDPSPRKKLFEYQQAQLEAEIENLSWKVERAATYDRGDLENQMNVAEKRRQTMLKDFFPS
ncbi:E3 ubiquitin-protein ligase ARIH2-like isoform X2 [Asterias amurensis]|uniref:E3 ubiquitin-protein ligase ARIH2-like isoform X2 n=1 Tax=Asterias amurensis TaxID=7602 RepID=UPI003AB17755